MHEEEKAKIKELKKKLTDLEIAESDTKEEIRKIEQKMFEDKLDLKEGHYYCNEEVGSCNAQYFKWTKGCRIEDPNYTTQDWRHLWIENVISVFSTRVEYRISFTSMAAIQLNISKSLASDVIGRPNIREIEKEEYERVLEKLKENLGGLE